MIALTTETTTTSVTLVNSTRQHAATTQKTEIFRIIPVGPLGDDIKHINKKILIKYFPRYTKLVMTQAVFGNSQNINTT
jgi:hypothetical protein